MLSIKIPTDKIGAVIGPGGSVIRKMIEEFGVTIDISDDGTVVIGSPDKDAAEGAKAQIESMTREVEVGTVYRGKVVRIMPFGAFVQLVPGKDGLVHISELSDERVPTVESVIKLGDELEVMVVNIDHLGRVDLSARAVRELRRREAEQGAEAKVNVEDFRARRPERSGGPGGPGGRGRFDGGGPRGRFGDRDRGGFRGERSGYRGDRGRSDDGDGGRAKPEEGDGGRGFREEPDAGRRPVEEPEAVRDDRERDENEAPARPRDTGGRRRVGGFRSDRPTPPPPPPGR
jgi:polyribonucleotide nucleotidyltransferase